MSNINTLKKSLSKKYKIDSDIFDFYSEYDYSLTYEENYTIIDEKLKELFGSSENDLYSQYQEEEIKTFKKNSFSEKIKSLFYKDDKKQLKTYDKLSQNSSISNSFNFKMNFYLNALLKSKTNHCLLINGTAGIGKTYYLKQELASNNKLKYKFISSMLPPTQFYKILHEYKDYNLIIFDDVRDIYNSRTINFLMSATDKERICSWISNASALKGTKPFKLNAKIIIINNFIPKRFKDNYKALESRSFNLNFELSKKDFIIRLKEISILKKIPLEVTDYLITLLTSKPYLIIDLRTLDKAYLFYTINKDIWKDLLLENLGIDEDLKAFWKATQEAETETERSKLFKYYSNKSIRSYWRLKKLMS